MQLSRTLSPALCCLLTLVVHHVAGLAIPRGAPGNAIGAAATVPKIDRRLTAGATFKAAAAEAEASLPGGKINRRQTPTTLLGTFQPLFRVAADRAAEFVEFFQAAAKAAADSEATFPDAGELQATVYTFQRIAEAATIFQDVFRDTASSKAAAEAVVLFQKAAGLADQAMFNFRRAARGELGQATTVAAFQEVATAAAAAASTFEAAVEAFEAAVKVSQAAAAGQVKS